MAIFLGTLAQLDGTFHVMLDDGRALVVSKDHMNYESLVECIKNNDVDKFEELYNIKGFEDIDELKPLSERGLTMNGESIYWNGKVLCNAVTDAIFNVMKRGLDWKPMYRFLENLMQNPSKNSVEQLFNFLNIHGIPLTEDGCFLAYKAVRKNYSDKHSGKFINTVGSVLEIPRNEVDDDPSRTCSNGFHVGAIGYSGPNGWYCGPGDRVVIVKVNPKDVVSVPHDHSYQKLRTCKYEVVSEYKGKLDKQYYHVEGDEDMYEFEEMEEADVQDVVTADEMMPGLSYTFMYTKGNVSDERFIEVDRVDANHIYGTLLSPEPNEGQYRAFRKDHIDEVCLLN